MEYNVIFTSPTYALSGVNTSRTNLIRSLCGHGIPSQLLLTHQTQDNFFPLPLSSDLPIDILPVTSHDTWETRWEELFHYLEKMSPCIYLPGYDWEYSCVSPKLSNHIGIVGVLHSDEQFHYDHLRRLGRYWNAIVAVSQTIAEKAVALDRTLANRICVIPYGIPVDRIPERTFEAGAPLKIIYTGRLIQYQKRILDLLKIVDALKKERISFQLTLIGDGPERERLMEVWRPYAADDEIQFLGTLSNEKTLEMLEQNDVFILTSDFEGLPVSLLEAMAKGCIPVVTDIPSGIPELVKDGVNGYRVPIGDTKAFVERLNFLQRHSHVRRVMSSKNFMMIAKGGYQIENIGRRYVNVFNRVMDEIESGSYRRPEGAIIQPPYLQITKAEHWRILGLYRRFQEKYPVLRGSKAINFARGVTRYPLLLKLLSFSYRIMGIAYGLFKRRDSSNPQ